MIHKHEPQILLDGQIKCRTCRKLLSSAEEEITKVSSARRVIKILQEIAVAGRYRATSFEKEFVVYSRDKNGNREEVTGERLSERNYRIFKRTISAEEVSE